MKIAPDTNVLVRFLTQDDPTQYETARETLLSASLITLSLAVLCELCWVLERGYRIPRAEIASVIRGLVGADNVVVDQSAVDAGLALIDAGGDFADGIIAFEGGRLGAEAFISFDKRAVKLVGAQGVPARLLA